jgi:hypothetical protein
MRQNGDIVTPLIGYKRIALVLLLNLSIAACVPTSEDNGSLSLSPSDISSDSLSE